jgi:hypothetical protein
MCVEIEVDEKVIDGVEELAAAIGQIVFEPGISPESRSGDCCLCYVDLQATASVNGYVYRTSSDPFYAYFDRK